MHKAEKPAPTAKSLLGKRAEELTAEELRGRGWEIVETNFRCRGGEIDIIARDGSTLVFVEVRSRRRDDFMSPAESVDYRKQQKIIRAAEYYLYTKQLDCDCRFDVSEVLFERGKPVSVEIIKGAFDA
jgi:putative endonuclease